MLGILLIAEPCKVCRVFCWTRQQYKCSIFPACRLQLSKMKQNVKTVLVQLAFPINAHQNANQKPIGSAPSYRAQCTLPPWPMCQTLLFDFSRVWFRDYFIQTLSQTAIYAKWKIGLLLLTCCQPTLHGQDAWALQAGLSTRVYTLPVRHM